MAQSTFFKSPSATSKNESDEVKRTRQLPLVSTDKEEKRILSAIRWIKDHPCQFKLEELNEKKLEEIAKATNGANIHVSGNCLLLSAMFLYNLKIGKAELAGLNTYPIYIGVHPMLTGQIILGQWLTTITALTKITKVEAEILSNFKLTGERAFIVGIKYTILGKHLGHSLNAVVLGEKENARVIFVDVWKSSKHIYTLQELEKRYKKSISIQILRTLSPMEFLKNPVAQKTEECRSGQTPKFS